VNTQHNQNLSSNLTFINLNKTCKGTSGVEVVKNEYIYKDSRSNDTETQSNSDTIRYQQNDPLMLLDESKISLFIRHKKQIPQEYISEIWAALRESEVCLTEAFMNNQDDINDKMRTILIDWLVDVHYKFNLTTETLFLAVGLIDRYVTLKPIQRSRYQLLGITALFIASKYEEIVYPDINNFVYVTDNTYAKKEILEMERNVLLALGFDVTMPSCYRFFEIIAMNYNFNEVEFIYGKYLLEQFLIDHHVNNYRPSLIAISVCYLVMKLNSYTNYSELYGLLYPDESQRLVKECAREIYHYVQNSENLIYKAVFNKYTKEKYFRVSLIGLKC
jgi:hypothetical protein